MNIVDVVFVKTTPDVRTLMDMVMRVNIIGQGLNIIATPIVAKVGNQNLVHITPLAEDAGVSGMLPVEPADGDKVFIGYLESDDLIDTGFEYDPLVG